MVQNIHGVPYGAEVIFDRPNELRSKKVYPSKWPLIPNELLRGRTSLFGNISLLLCVPIAFIMGQEQFRAKVMRQFPILKAVQDVVSGGHNTDRAPK